MPILFSAVSLDREVFNTFASCDGNFEEILELVLAKVPKGDYKMTYLHGRYLLHYISENKYLYFCITDRVCIYLALLRTKLILYDFIHIEMFNCN